MRDARIDAHVAAKTAYLVLAPPDGKRAGKVRVLLDGRPTQTVEVRSQRSTRSSTCPKPASTA